MSKSKEEQLSWDEFKTKMDELLEPIIKFCSKQQASIGLFINRSEDDGPDQDVLLASNVKDEQMLAIFMADNVETLLERIEEGISEYAHKTVN